MDANEVARLVERLRVGAGLSDCIAAADALTTLSARLASRDREISALMDKADNFERAAVANYRRAESAVARLAECERDLESRKNYTDADYVRLHKAHCMTADKLASATAHAERMEAALTELQTRICIASNISPSLSQQLLGIIDAALADAPAPGMTDLMVAPETLDAFMEANPLPADAPVQARDVTSEELRLLNQALMNSTTPAPVQGDGRAKRAECCHKTVIVHCEGCPYIPVARCSCFRCKVAAPVANGGENA